MKHIVFPATAMLLLAGCANTGASGDMPLLDTTWNLERLFTEDREYTGPKTPHLRFETERVAGNDGCNNFSGPYKRDSERLNFGLLASTRMICPQINDFDLVFNKMLIMTRSYRISGNRLDLYAGDTRLASFVAAGQN